MLQQATGGSGSSLVSQLLLFPERPTGRFQSRSGKTVKQDESLCYGSIASTFSQPSICFPTFHRKASSHLSFLLVSVGDLGAYFISYYVAYLSLLHLPSHPVLPSL